MALDLKKAGTIGGMIVLAAIALAGWLRKPSPSYEASAPYAQPAFYNPQAGGPNEIADEAARPSPVAGQNAGRYSTRQRGVRTVNPSTGSASRSVTSTRAGYAPVRKKRSTAKSVAIVAGSAGTGAAIGAIAGGGKGAGIGALAGGAAGFVYDRLTHDRK